MATKTIVLDGDKFNNMESFYNEIHKAFCPNILGFGRNISALRDVCRGGFGVFGLDELVEVVWVNSEKSRKDFSYPAPEGYEERMKDFKANWKLPPKPLGHSITQFDVLVETIADHDDHPNLHLELK